MPSRPDSTTNLQHWLDGVRAGNAAAGQALVQHACERLRLLTRKMLRGYPVVHRWEQTDDVLQAALIRLMRALDTVRPETVRGFFQLAAKLIRQELIDLGRHYLGPQGIGGNHASGADLSAAQDHVRATTGFHELVESLPAEEREAVDLLVYQGMTEREAAAALSVSDRTVKRRWRSARLTLHRRLTAAGHVVPADSPE